MVVVVSKRYLLRQLTPNCIASICQRLIDVKTRAWTYWSKVSPDIRFMAQAFVIVAVGQSTNVETILSIWVVTPSWLTLKTHAGQLEKQRPALAGVTIFTWTTWLSGRQCKRLIYDCACHFKWSRRVPITIKSLAHVNCRQKSVDLCKACSDTLANPVMMPSGIAKWIVTIAKSLIILNRNTMTLNCIRILPSNINNENSFGFKVTQIRMTCVDGL